MAIAIVGEVITDDQTGMTTVPLDGSRSFDTAGSIIKFEWEVVSEPFAGIPISLSPANDANGIPAGLTAELVVFSRALTEKDVSSIEFRLTVTDDGIPAAIDTTTVTANINHGPTAVVTVSAMLPAPRGQQVDGFDDNGNGVVDENSERYTVEGVIHGPGQSGNADYEWDIREGSLLVVDGSGSFDADGPLSAGGFIWKVLYASDVPDVTASLPGDTVGQKALSTDEDPEVAPPASDLSETIALLPFVSGSLADPYYLYYVLTVTDEHGVSDSQVVKIVIRDAHDNPEVEIKFVDYEPDALGTGNSGEHVQAAGEDRYVISSEAAAEGVTLTALGTGSGSARTRALVHTWFGAGVEPSDANRAGPITTAVFRAPEGTEEGDTFVVEVEVVDPSELTGSTSVELVVAENVAPEAAAPEDIDTPDGINGGYPPSNPPTGVVVLEGFGFDRDGDQLRYRWEQVSNRRGSPLLVTFRGHRLALAGTDARTAKFPLPEVTTGTEYVLYVQLTVTDRWGVSDSDVVRITIRDGVDDLIAIPGPGQRVQPGDIVRLRGRVSAGLVSADAISLVNYKWSYVGIETHPLTENRSEISEAEIAEGFVSGQWFPDAEGSYDSTAGGRLITVSGRYPYFDAPLLYQFNSVKLVFALTVSGVPQQGDDTATVTITVVNGFFSGDVDGPDYCANLSLGGPTTYPVDLDKDGVADTCSLNTTRRAAIAHQNVLERLAILNLQEFESALHGPPGDPATEGDESDPDQGTCHTAPDNLPGDAPELLNADTCGAEGSRLRQVSSPPAPVDPTKAAQFFSGPVITGPTYCANLSLGGQPLYAYDRDGDGIADTCSLAYTRREAAARQNALEAAFADHPQYHDALAAACASLGTLDFGDDPADLAQDHCAVPPPRPELGQPLPAAAA